MGYGMPRKSTTLRDIPCRQVSGVQLSADWLFFPFVRRARARRSDEELLAVLEGYVAAVGAIRTVLGLISFDEDLGAREKRDLRPAAAQESVRRAGFHHPVGDGAVGALDVDVNPRVRIYPLHLRHRSLQLDRPLRVKLGGEGMVREYRHGRQKQTETGNHYGQLRSHRKPPAS